VPLISFMPTLTALAAKAPAGVFLADRSPGYSASSRTGNREQQTWGLRSQPRGLNDNGDAPQPKPTEDDMSGTDREECKPCEHTLNVHGPSGCHKKATGFEGAYRCLAPTLSREEALRPDTPKNNSMRVNGMGYFGFEDDPRRRFSATSLCDSGKDKLAV